MAQFSSQLQSNLKIGFYQMLTLGYAIMGLEGGLPRKPASHGVVSLAKPASRVLDEVMQPTTE